MSALLGFAGRNRYGNHPFISGPVYAAEYNGYPGTLGDLGAALTDTKGTLGAAAAEGDDSQPSDLQREPPTPKL